MICRKLFRVVLADDIEHEVHADKSEKTCEQTERRHADV